MTSNEIFFENALQELRRGTTTGNARGRWPYFFIVGAGVSARESPGAPGVPLAWEIIEMCEKRAGLSPPAGSAASSATRYSRAILAACPHLDNQRELFQSLIEPKKKRQPIPVPNLLLAEILLDPRTPYVVTTPNFDDFLERALSLLGETPLVYNGAPDMGQADGSGRHVQIVHIHGTAREYNIANSDAEVRRRARSRAMQRTFLGRMLDHLAPLVVGYSGWENDVIMKSLHERLHDRTSAMPHNIYWFCYRREEAARLPSWLKTHPCVRLVVARQDRRDLITMRPAESLDPDPILDGEGLDAGEIDPPLPARRVFTRMIEDFGIPRPALLEDPLGHFARTLRDTLAADTDPALAEVIRQVEHARALLEQDRVEHRDEQRRELLGRLTSATPPRQAVWLVRELLAEPGDLTPAILARLAQIAWDAALTLNDNSQFELDAYDAIVKVADLWLRRGLRSDAKVPLTALRALLYRGSAMMNTGLHASAAETFREAIRRFEREPKWQFVHRVVRARRKLAMCAYRLDDAATTLRELGRAISKHERARHPKVAEQVALCLYNRAVILSRRPLRRLAEAEADYRLLLDRFAKPSSSMGRVVGAHARLNLAIVVAEGGRFEEAVALLDEVVQLARLPIVPVTAPPAWRRTGGRDAFTEARAEKQKLSEIAAVARRLRADYASRT